MTYRIHRSRPIVAAGGTPFADDFNDNSIDPTKWTTSIGADISINETSQQMQFIVDTSYSGAFNASELISVPSFDFTDKKVEVDLPSISSNIGNGVSASGGTQLIVYDTANGNNYALILIDFGTYHYQRSNNGTLSQSSTGGNTGSDSKWRIQHVSSTNVWEFWTFNGTTWTKQFTSAAANWNPTSVKIKLSIYIYGPNQVNKITKFDNVTSDATY